MKMLVKHKQMRIISDNSDRTKDIGAEMAAELHPGDIVYLYGELGSGKTVLVKGLCAGLGVNEDVTSPSFVIATEYSGRVKVSHIDLYRLDGPQVDALPLDEYIPEDGITVIEWADRLGTLAHGIIVRITIVDKKSRELLIEDLRD
jgi:tRNA threonylcarbamoyladenosine biosynthesis protein TsaE